MENMQIEPNSADVLIGQDVKTELHCLKRVCEASAPKLLTPGPLALSSQVKNQMLLDLGSRGAEIKKLTYETRQGIGRIIQSTSTHDCILLQGSGTFAVEAAIATFCNETTKALVLVNGIYGERIAEILHRREIAHELITCSSDTPHSIDLVADRLETDHALTHLIFVHCETTTGILNPIEELCALSARYGVVSMVDAMSSLGAVEINRQTTPFDILISSGNKAIEAPPGIAFAVVDRSLLRRCMINRGSFCFDLYDQWARFEGSGEWRSTPPTHVLQALHSAVELLEEEGVQARRLRYEKVRDRLTQALVPLGLKLVVPSEFQSPVCLAFSCPAWKGRENAAFDDFCQHLTAVNLHVYTKMDLKTKSFRIGCIGQIQSEWVELLIERVRDFGAKSGGYSL